MEDLLNVARVFTGKRFPFKFIFSNEYWMVDVGRHIFPVKKYRMIYEHLLSIGARKENFLEPESVKDEDILLVHSVKYYNRLISGTLTEEEKQVLEIRFSPSLVRFSRLTVGGTILTLFQALKDGLAFHIGGGFHHAFSDHGEGFCLLNDVAVAVEKAIRENQLKRILIVDCDVHQGNGTAAIFSGRVDVFTFSIHQTDLYPLEKVPGSLDVGLWSGAEDEKYHHELKSNLLPLFDQFKPEAIVYLAGADPYEFDQLGGLKLTKAGLKKRDKLVIEEARKRGIPVAIVLAGGYAADIKDTVEIHLNTIRVARMIQRVYSRVLVSSESQFK